MRLTITTLLGEGIEGGENHEKDRSKHSGLGVRDEARKTKYSIKSPQSGTHYYPQRYELRQLTTVFRRGF